MSDGFVRVREAPDGKLIDNEVVTRGGQDYLRQRVQIAGAADGDEAEVAGGRLKVDATAVVAGVVSVSNMIAAVETGLAKEHVTAASPHAARLSDGAAFYKATTPSDTQPISASALPLPTGAATAVNQATIIAGLSSILTELGQKTEPADAQHVVVDSSALPSGAGTEATLAAILTELGQKTEPANQQHTIVDSSALPTGAATEATLATRATTTDVQAVRDRLPSVFTGGGGVKVGVVDALPVGTNTIGKIDVNRNAFATLLKFEASSGEELRRDETATDDYHGRAADGAAEASTVWEIVRFYKDVLGKVTRTRYRTGVAWSSRTSGW